MASLSVFLSVSVSLMRRLSLRVSLLHSHTHRFCFNSTLYSSLVLFSFIIRGKSMYWMQRFSCFFFFNKLFFEFVLLFCSVLSLAYMTFWSVAFSVYFIVSSCRMFSVPLYSSGRLFWLTMMTFTFFYQYCIAMILLCRWHFFYFVCGNASK